MKKIEIEEYVRTNTGKFDKVINNNYYIPQYIECEKGIVDKENIVNHSKNLIDLIEVGDLVNGYKVLEIADSIYENSKRILIYRDTREEKWIYIQEYDGKLHTQDDIVEILTHEQYQANCYTVERKEENESND